MPVNLDDLDNVGISNISTLTPKFFSSHLTGAGKALGVINKGVRPSNPPQDAASLLAYTRNEDITKKSRSISGDVTTIVVPMGTILAPLLRCTDTAMRVQHDETDSMIEIEDKQSPNGQWFFNLTPQGLVRISGTDDAGSTNHTLRIQYRMEMHYIHDAHYNTDNTGLLCRTGRSYSYENNSYFKWSYNPMDDISDFINNTVGITPTMTKMAEIAAWMDDYDVHDHIVKLAEAWSSETMGHTMSMIISDIFDAYLNQSLSNQIANGHRNIDVIEKIMDQLRYMETYQVPLEVYTMIHKTISSTVPDDIAEEMYKQNLNLLMSATLADLDAIRDQLQVPPAITSSTPALTGRFSKQQTDAIETSDPLVLCQAGAGTGKSTTILGRIDRLIQRGVDPSDITVLSFTNAAADNIKTKNPSVNSMTTARMIHDIYRFNHPSHDLSTISTIVNALDIFYPQDDVAAGLRKYLVAIENKEVSATTMLNSFIEQNRDGVIAILDSLKQTTLEIEIIMCYQGIATMTEPASVTGSYLIIDEVQDNSIFEFIYALRYAAKHKANMFLVGDCSQTLYEFRASNPKALNALESSGVFTTYQLTTNYRSNQEILDFANVALSDIEANAYANIQLQSNILNPPTAKSFQEKVILDYHRANSVKEFDAALPNIIRDSVKDYIDACLARGEKVAFLAHRRADVKTFEKTLGEIYPNHEIGSLISDITFNSTIFSKYIKMYWNDVKQVEPGQASFVISQEIVKNLGSLIRSSTSAAKAEPGVLRMIQQWWIASAYAINGWVNQEAANMITRDEFFDLLRDCMLSYEISQNAIKQSMVNQRNKERKENTKNANAPLIVSTIHGAKGLEFDNVVVLHKMPNGTLTEADKRMYYVAFTRAMNTEYIISCGKNKNASIVSDYDLLVKGLTERDNPASTDDDKDDPIVLDDTDVQDDDADL